MPANANWARWVFASVSKHFDDRKGTLTLYIEGQYRDTAKLVEFIELRTDGPTLREISKGFWLLTVEINVLITASFDESDYHRVHRFAGQVQAAFTSMIPVYKHGDGVDDDGSFLGCLILQHGHRRESTELNHFGRIDVNTPLVQATVEGHYTMDLEE